MNRPPTVSLTSGPVEGDTVSYAIEIAWSGSDPDGVVARYEVAVDPPAAFTEEEIAEGGPGIASEQRPGRGGAPDTTRVTKIDSGGAASFDWIHTAATSRFFRLSTPEAESTQTNGVKTPTGRFSGMHAVYVRAVDDDDAVSPPDKVAFTATTVAPTSQIMRPDVFGQAGLVLGSTIRVEWDGRDPDAPEAAQKPVGYLFNLVRQDTLPCCPFPEVSPEYFFRYGQWIYQPAENLGRTFSLHVPAQYIFGVRAVDENGAVEPFLNYGRNVFKFQAHSGAGLPTILVSYAGMAYRFPTQTPITAEAPVGQELQFLVSCTAESYGESCPEIRWGLDLVDLDAGWSDWSANPLSFGFSLPEPGVPHFLYVQARDALGNITLAVLALEAIDFSFDREALYVDDFPDATYPRDSEHDSFWFRAFEYYAANSDIPPDQLFQFQVYGPNDAGNYHPIAPLLSDLSRYKLLIWECKRGYNAETALLIDTALTSRLRAYLTAGGKLWLGGFLQVLRPCPSSENVDLVGPCGYPLSFAPGDFAWDILKIRTDEIGLGHDLIQATPFPGVLFDTMNVAPGKLPSGSDSLSAEAVLSPIVLQPGEGILDSLFAYGAASTLHLGQSSPFHGKPIAIRWHDPDPDREQGRIQWFGFPLYYFQEFEAQDTFNKALDWFREEEVPSGP